MPFLKAPVLTVDANTIHKIDTEDAKDVFRLWRLFSRCSDLIEEGRRLENLSWRLWNRETFYCAPDEANAAALPTSISQRRSEGRYTAGIPDLSSSINSVDEAIESDYASTSAPPTMKYRVRRQDSGCNRSRGKGRHITPNVLEKMVITIQEKKDLEPLTVKITPPQLSNTSTPIIPASQPKVSTATSSPQKSPASTTTADGTFEERSATIVVCGFFPFQISPPCHSIPLINTLASGPESALASHRRLATPKKYAMFALAGSSQSDNDKNSLRNSTQQNSRRRALSDALRRSEQKKQTSFRDEVATQTIEEMSDNVFKTDDDIDECAIGDDESSDWEDSTGKSGKSSVDDKLSFPRVQSRHNLISRRSLIKTILHQGDWAAALQSATSESTPELQHSGPPSPQGLSDAPSSESNDSEPLTTKSRMRPGQKVPRTGAQTNTPHQAALSPKTTRRQMLATELTASLRRHLLWERKQKNQTASAVLKRTHTAHDVAGLKQYPDKVHLGTEVKDDHSSWNQYFNNDYNFKGW